MVVGFGSAGQRHSRLLKELGADVCVVSRRRPSDYRCFDNIRSAIENHCPDLVVISNETSSHAGSIAQLIEAGHDGDVLVEKPLYSFMSEQLARLPFRRLCVGYQLRFHPLVTMLKQKLLNQRIVSVQMEAAQKLSLWRPDRDWRSTYSAEPSLGGGVLRDLSHELDLMLWLFGPWLRVAALGGCSGVLDIKSDDVWTILVATEGSPTGSIHLNYHAHPARRRIAVETSEHTIVADLINNTLSCGEQVIRVDASRDDCQIDQYRALRSENDQYCTFAQGLSVVEFIVAIEAAALTGMWQHR